MAKSVGGWVVYKMYQIAEDGPNAVCEQREWEALEVDSPGHNRLLRAGIATEGEAERIARELPGGTSARPSGLRTRLGKVAQVFSRTTELL